MSITARCTLAAILLGAGVLWHVSAQTSIAGVVDTSHFAATSGNFGPQAWLDVKTMLEQPVSLKPGPTLRVEFPRATLAAPR